MILIAPKTDRYFWWFHFSLWGAFSLINFFSRQFNQVESLEQGIVSLVVLLVINTLLCLILRELVHRFKLNDLNTPKIWLKLSGLIVVFGFLSALLMTLALGLYFLLAGYTPHLVFFMITVYQNWLIMSLTVGLWAVIYVVMMHMQTLNQLKATQQEIQLKLKEAELNNLSGQLNPHFLFNGLNNIRALINEDGNKARHMLTELSQLLRYSLNAPKNRLTTLHQELEMVRAYIVLAQIQYEERLSYQEHIEPEMMQACIPPLMVQLLVENAIRHGIDQHNGQGVLKLDIKRKDKDLLIRVSNPGQIKSNGQPHSGIGIENIKKRLQLLFGNEQSFSLTAANDTVVAELKMPLNEEVKHEN